MTWSICGQRLFSYDRLDSGTVHCKVLLLGDENTGKTHLIKTISAKLIEESVEVNGNRSFAIYKSSCDIPKYSTVQMEIWDFSGSCKWHTDDLPADVDIILLCMDVNRPKTHEAIINLWIRIIREFYGFDVAVALVGCKSDMRCDLETIKQLSQDKQVAVTYHQASLTSSLIGAFAYVETSKRCKQTIQQLFEVVALKYIGKLTSKHLVFRRQRSNEKHRHSSTSSGKSDTDNGHGSILKFTCCLL